ncbi:pyridoxamine 5'-phosphate oxidase family protein [Mordavella massiliensis]|uniref:Pyridoxamine 5'-phosphate oxidase family protein n=2 Tax=Mordavella massiliensis TaxID=1871024 RepID=A0A939BGQ8_9CLOT|nr:pyridoxamine 5'-phosphate oxidase family protein [Mordavella massiliensis]
MRRPKRRMTDIGEITKMIGECMVCRVGMVSEGKVYVVPMNFGYESRGDKLTFYLHSAKVGRKIGTLKEEPEVCIELDCRHGLKEAELPCSHSYYYASLIGTGKVRVLKTFEEKLHGLKEVMRHQTGKEFDNFDEKWVNAVEVLKVELDEYACKHYDGTN